MKARNNLQAGQALIVATIFFIIASTLVLGGFVSPVVRTTKSTQDLLTGDRSYYLSESGAEDVAYRLKNNLAVSSSETLTLSGQSVTTKLTDVPDGKQIDAEANWSTLVRSVKLKLKIGVGASFNYGIQAGNGGFVMANTAQVQGNVYSNGNISGGTVTGSAIAANSATSLPDQVNDTPATPSSSVTFADSNTSSDYPITSWSSVLSHSSAGDQSLALNQMSPAANSTVEPRRDAVDQLLVKFNQPITLTSSASSPIFVHNELTNADTAVDSTLVNGDPSDLVQLDINSSLPEGCFSVDLTGYVNATGNLKVYFRNLIGDVDGDGTVTDADVLAVKAEFNAANNNPVTPDTAKYDLNHSGVITNSDVLLAKSRLGRGASCSLINTYEDFAQSFQVDSTALVSEAQFFIKKSGIPANATVRITTDTNGSPNTTSLTTGTLSAVLVTTDYAWVSVSFVSNPQLTAGVTYWLVIDAAASAGNSYIIGANANGYSRGQGKIGRYENTTWANTVPALLDGYFKLYPAGATSEIDGAIVGADAWAHRVTDSTVTGAVYCKVGSGNNKECDTSRDDPTPQAMPLSDANLAQFKADAATGGAVGETGGNYTAGTTLGPKQIIGNLKIKKDLKITGTVWVQGNLLVTDNNKTVTLDPSYGANAGVIIVDGYIDLANGMNFTGTDQAGSYVLLVTTSDCDPDNSCDRYAIDVPNNAGTVILNAQKGTIRFKNNSGAKEATANKIVMENGAVVTYETGLANINFTSGPSGGLSFDGWSETQ